jgi:hypothetical protein
VPQQSYNKHYIYIYIYYVISERVYRQERYPRWQGGWARGGASYVVCINLRGTGEPRDQGLESPLWDGRG